MEKKRVLYAIFLLLIGLLMLPGVGGTAEVTLKLGHVAPPGPTTHDIAATKFAERVAANTGGKVEVKVFGNSQFGGLQEHWAQVKTGAIDLFVQDVSAASMVEPDPKNFNVMLAPYTFDSQDHYQKFVHSEFFRNMMSRVEKAGNVKFVNYLGDRTPRGFTTTNKNVVTPAEIKGLKVRVPELPIFVETYKAWGATPTPVSAKDLYMSLKSGMVEGMDQDMTMTFAAKYYEVQKFFVAIDYNRSGMGCWINAKKWESLSKDFQSAFLKSGQETEDYVNKFTAQQLADAEKGLVEAGMKIIRPDLKPWKELAEKEVARNDGKIWEKGLYAKIKTVK
jgi:TRAP-type transport system periplasmic protein